MYCLGFGEGNEAFLKLTLKTWNNKRVGKNRCWPRSLAMQSILASLPHLPAYHRLGPRCKRTPTSLNIPFCLIPPSLPPIPAPIITPAIAAPN